MSMKGALLIAVMLSTTVLVESYYSWEGESGPTAPREDLRCGSEYGNAICDPDGKYPCCSDWYWCGNTAAHCNCDDCADYRECHFPFNYEGKTFYGCTGYYGHGRSWCSKTRDYKGNWKYCTTNRKRSEDQKKEVLQDAAAVLKEVVEEAEKEAAMDLLEGMFAILDGNMAVPQDPAAEWEKKEEEAEEDAEEKLEEALEEELEELEEELKNKEGDE
ncbi:uncharacterized protein LOC144920439 [Branchiostoma floridae x Branchiostoma belcheri]